MRLVEKLAMVKLIWIFVFVIFIQNVNACNCFKKSSLRSEVKEADIIIKAKILKKNIITYYVIDTSGLLAFYSKVNENNSYSYEKYKEEMFGRKLFEYTIQIIKSFKGEHRLEEVKFRTGPSNGDCGYSFLIGKTYLIFGKNAFDISFSKDYPNRPPLKLENVYTTNICMRTKLFSEDDKDLVKLNKF